MHYKIRKSTCKTGWVCLKYLGKGKYEYLKREAWPGGLNSFLTIDQARSVIRNINSTRPILEEERKREKTLNRLKAINDSKTNWLPQDVVKDWEESELSNLDKRALAKQRSIQTYVKEMMIVVNKEPKRWNGFAKLFYDYIAKHPVSEDYYTRILRSLNHYGYFYSVWRDTPYRDVPLPIGDSKERILKAFRQKPGSIKRSEPLLLEDLKSIETILPLDAYNWILASLWFGLRPEEADQLSTQNDRWQILPDGLRIWQPKIGKRMVDPERAFKIVPIQDERQKEVLERIIKGPVKRPTRRQREKLPERVRLYGGRHGYVQLVKYVWNEQKEKLRDNLGHQDQRTTDKHYYEQGALPGRKKV